MNKGPKTLRKLDVNCFGIVSFAIVSFSRNQKGKTK